MAVPVDKNHTLVNNIATTFSMFRRRLVTGAQAPVLRYRGISQTKGNVDAELVLHSSAIEIGNYEKVIVVSGDGDFYCLYEYLIEKEKLLKILIPNKFKYSSLLKKFSKNLYFVSDNKRNLSKKSGGHDLQTNP